MTNSNQDARCIFCGQPEQIIWVHGHGQCAHCKTNAFPCCDGDECIVATPEQAPISDQKKKPVNP